MFRGNMLNLEGCSRHRSGKLSFCSVDHSKRKRNTGQRANPIANPQGHAATLGPLQGQGDKGAEDPGEVCTYNPRIGMRNTRGHESGPARGLTPGQQLAGNNHETPTHGQQGKRDTAIVAEHPPAPLTCVSGSSLPCDGCESARVAAQGLCAWLGAFVPTHSRENRPRRPVS